MIKAAEAWLLQQPHCKLLGSTGKYRWPAWPGVLFHIAARIPLGNPMPDSATADPYFLSNLPFR
jgi:hypothetical protein